MLGLMGWDLSRTLYDMREETGEMGKLAILTHSFDRPVYVQMLPPAQRRCGCPGRRAKDWKSAGPFRGPGARQGWT